MLALLIWALATYGFVVGLYNLLQYFYIRTSLEGSITLVMVVCDGESYVEGILRGITYKAFLSKKQLRIVVIDTGSKDSTREIVRRMQARDARIEYVESTSDFDAELIENIWQDGGLHSAFVLFDLRTWRNPRKIMPSLARIVG